MRLPSKFGHAVLVVFIPGSLATLPWLLLASNYCERLAYSDYKIEYAVIWVILSVMLGALLESLSTRIEVEFDSKFEPELQKEEDKKEGNVTYEWFYYLSYISSDGGTIGFRYINRLCDVLYFQLCMINASRISIVGFFLCYLFFISCIVKDTYEGVAFNFKNAYFIDGFLLAFMIGLLFFIPHRLKKMAKCTHKTINDARYIINDNIRNKKEELTLVLTESKSEQSGEGTQDNSKSKDSD